MPHLIDKETGLCEICNRLEIAAIKEGKKYKRKNYDIRKHAITNLTDKDDPEYRKITDRHYVPESKKPQASKSVTNTPRETYTKPLPLENRQMKARIKEALRSDVKQKPVDAKDVLETRKKKEAETRNTLRKVNLANVPHLAQNPKPNTADSYDLIDYSNVEEFLDDDDDDELQFNQKVLVPLKKATPEPEFELRTPVERRKVYTIVPKETVYHKPVEVVRLVRKKKVYVHHHYNDEDDDQSEYEYDTDDYPKVVYLN